MDGMDGDMIPLGVHGSSFGKGKREKIINISLFKLGLTKRGLSILLIDLLALEPKGSWFAEFKGLLALESEGMLGILN